MSETLSRWRVFVAWADELEERWLEEMARQGWYLERSYGVRFVFRRGPAAEVRYRLDYRPDTGGKLREFVGLCRDAGWEHVGQFIHWQYFRTSDPAAPEIFTDHESKVGKYRRLAWLLALVLVMNLASLIGNVAVLTTEPDHAVRWVYVVQLAVIALLGYGIVQLRRCYTRT